MLGLSGGVIAQHDGITGPYNTTTNTKSINIPNSSGTSSYVTVPDDTSLSFVDGTDGNNIDKPFTIAMWGKNLWAGPSSRGTMLSKGSTVGETNEYRIFAGENRIYIDLTDEQGGGGDSDDANRTYWTGGVNSFPAKTTNWVHLVFTYSGVTGEAPKLYRDSITYTHHSNDNHSTGGMSDMSGALEFGRMPDISTYALNGNLCQVIMWKDWIATQQDVDYLYASGTAHRNPLQGAQNYGGASKVVAWWPFDADLNDASANSNNGTAAGSAALATTVPF